MGKNFEGDMSSGGARAEPGYGCGTNRNLDPAQSRRPKETPTEVQLPIEPSTNLYQPVLE
jgi:hypothetical protein